MRPRLGRNRYPPRVLQESLPACRTTTAATWAPGSPRCRQSGATERRTKQGLRVGAQPVDRVPVGHVEFGRQGVSASLRKNGRSSITADGRGIGLAPHNVEPCVWHELDVRMEDHLRRNPRLEGTVFMWLGEPEHEVGSQSSPVSPRAQTTRVRAVENVTIVNKAGTEPSPRPHRSTPATMVDPG